MGRHRCRPELSERSGSRCKTSGPESSSIVSPETGIGPFSDCDKISRRAHPASTYNPVLPFLVFFFWKWKGKPPKKQGFFIPAEPLKSLEKKGKTLKKKNKEFLAGEKNKEFPKNKERKDREGPSIPALQRVEERPLGGLWQPVPQNGRIHLHILGEYHWGRNYYILYSEKIKNAGLGVLSHHLRREMKSPHLVDIS